MITRDIIRKNIRFFEQDRIYSLSDLCEKIDFFKRCLINIDNSLNFNCVVGSHDVDFLGLAFLFALFELQIPIVNARSVDSVYVDKNVSNNKIFLRKSDQHKVREYTNENLDVVIIEEMEGSSTDVSFKELAANKLLLTYFSSGTTGLPKKYFHSHETVLASAINAKIFHKEGGASLWNSADSINHFGIVTTTILPTLMMSDVIVFNTANQIKDHVQSYAELTENLQKEQIKITSSTVFAHSVSILSVFADIFADDIGILTGAGIFVKRIQSVAKKSLPNHKNVKIYNVYGCTELATPLLWSKYDIFSDYTDDQFLTFTDVIDNVEIIMTESGLIEGFKPNKIFTSNREEDLKCPDDIKREGDNFRFINRKDFIMPLFGISHIGSKVIFNINEVMVQNFLCGITDKTITSIKFVTDRLDHAVIFKFTIFCEEALSLSIDEINDKFVEFIKTTLKITPLDSFARIFNRIVIVPDLQSKNNGLKFDVNELKKYIAL